MGDQELDRHHQAISASAILESIQSLATANPEAFGKLVVEILCKLAELDRDAYEYLIGRMISRELYAAGLQVALEQAKQALSLGNTRRVEERISAIGGWLRVVETLGSRERFELLLAEEQETRPRSSHPYVM